jgi:hypothetical protein
MYDPEVLLQKLMTDDYRVAEIDGWFTEQDVVDKRLEIQNLMIELRKEWLVSGIRVERDKDDYNIRPIVMEGGVIVIE